MKMTHKEQRSNTRKMVSLLGKIALVLMGEPIPQNKINQKPAALTPYQIRKNSHSPFLKCLIFMLKLPLLVFIAGMKKEKPYKPTSYEQAAGEKMFSGKYYVPDDKF